MLLSQQVYDYIATLPDEVSVPFSINLISFPTSFYSSKLGQFRMAFEVERRENTLHRATLHGVCGPYSLLNLCVQSAHQSYSTDMKGNLHCLPDLLSTGVSSLVCCLFFED